MKELDDILKELGISKVKLAKYLGVSRQMVYNYLELPNLEDWPKDKKMKLFTLLDIKSADELSNIKITTDYMLKVEKILDDIDIDSFKGDMSAYEFKDLGKKQQHLLVEIIDILKEILAEDDDAGKSFTAMKYLYHFLQLFPDINEIKYILSYFAKSNGFVGPREFAFNEEEQTTFEGIMFQAMSLFTNGGASKSKIIEAHKRFEADIESKREEKLSRTQELNTAKVQALKELGYTEINETNASEVFEKIAEIQSRKLN
jgi:transcriptional regulator with XRE-family HTH domain